MNADALDRLSILGIKLKKLPEHKHLSIHEEIKRLSIEPPPIVWNEYNELCDLNERAWEANEVLYHQLDSIAGRDLNEPERSVINAMKTSVDLNKQRIRVKNSIDLKLGNGLREEKSFDV